jgi:hypothetical protein
LRFGALQNPLKIVMKEEVSKDTSHAQRLTGVSCTGLPWLTAVSAWKFRIPTIHLALQISSNH